MLDDIGKQPLDVVGKTLNRGQIGLLCSVVHGGGGGGRGALVQLLLCHETSKH